MEHDHIEQVYEREFQNRKDILIKFKDKYILKQVQKESPSNDVFDYTRFQDVTDEYIEGKRFSIGKNPRNPVDRELVSCEDCHKIVDSFFNSNCEICGGNLKLWKPHYSIPEKLYSQFNSEAEETYGSLEYMEAMIKNNGDREMAILKAREKIDQMR